MEKKIVLCHGVFDLLHLGHIKHFNEARTFGDILIVTVTPDSFVNKGPNRPAFTIEHRLEALSALESIEDLEILRLLEMGNEVLMIEVSDSSVAVDIPEDLESVRSLIHD